MDKLEIGDFEIVGFHITYEELEKLNNTIWQLSTISKISISEIQKEFIWLARKTNLLTDSELKLNGLYLPKQYTMPKKDKRPFYRKFENKKY